jgi:hypothetical protein
VAIGESTEYLDERGNAALDLAEVLSLAGRDAEAAEAVEPALRLFEEKGNLVSADRARSFLAELGGR